MSYKLIDTTLYCSGCKKSHHEKGVALCVIFNDLSEAVTDYQSKSIPKIVLMTPNLADEFIRVKTKVENTSDDLQNTGMLGAGMFIGGVLTGTPPLAWAGVLKMFGARAGKAYQELKNIHGKDMPFVFCSYGVCTRQDDGRMSVLLPNIR